MVLQRISFVRLCLIEICNNIIILSQIFWRVLADLPRILQIWRPLEHLKLILNISVHLFSTALAAGNSLCKSVCCIRDNFLILDFFDLCFAGFVVDCEVLIDVFRKLIIVRHAFILQRIRRKHVAIDFLLLIYAFLLGLLLCQFALVQVFLRCVFRHCNINLGHIAELFILLRICSNQFGAFRNITFDIPWLNIRIVLLHLLQI